MLHILAELNPSGAETMLYAAAPQLANFGLQAEILTTGSQPGPYAQQLESAGYVVHHIAFEKRPQFFWQVYRLLKYGAYDIIHLHTERANFWLGMLALMTSKRVVRTIHATFRFTGFLGWRRQWQRHLLAFLGLRHIAISQSVQDTESQYHRLQVPIIQNWYDSTRFKQTEQRQRMQARAELGIADDTFVLISIGNCSTIKNHSALIQALAQMTTCNWLYLHIGIEKDHAERELASQLEISERINFCGLQTDVLPYLRASDLFVMPSTHEGFGIAAIEAIATGLPALLSDVPGLRDFKNIFTGLYYCQPEANAIAATLSTLIHSPSEHMRQRCQVNAQIAEQNFGIHRGLAEYCEVYKSAEK